MSEDKESNEAELLEEVEVGDESKKRYIFKETG